jgi:hypothetical protein
MWLLIVHDPSVRAETRSLIEAQARERALELIKKASEDHEEISNMDMSGICSELGGVWMPDERRCD